MKDKRKSSAIDELKMGLIPIRANMTAKRFIDLVPGSHGMYLPM
jgi:hypothetical protein